MVTGSLKTIVWKNSSGKKYEHASAELSQADFQSEYYPYMTSTISTAVTTVAFIGIISIGAYLVIRGRIAVSIILSLSQLIGSVLVPIELMPQYVSQVKGARRVLREVTPYLKKEPQTAGFLPAASAGQPAKWNSMEFDHIRFGYGNGAGDILCNVSLRLERGKKYALIGKSGSGKSTLAKVLAGINSCSFSLKIDGKPADCSVLPYLVSYMEQDSFLFQDTIYENVSLYRELPRGSVEEILDKMNFGANLAERCSLLDLAVGENGAQLSGGERQRVALARELLSRKDVLILDESMSAVDQATAGELKRFVMNLEGVTCLLITHHLESYVISACDQVWLMENGSLKEECLSQENQFR